MPVPSRSDVRLGLCIHLWRILFIHSTSSSAYLCKTCMLSHILVFIRTVAPNPNPDHSLGFPPPCYLLSRKVLHMIDNEHRVTRTRCWTSWLPKIKTSWKRVYEDVYTMHTRQWWRQQSIPPILISWRWHWLRLQKSYELILWLVGNLSSMISQVILCIHMTRMTTTIPPSLIPLI